MPLIEQGQHGPNTPRTGCRAGITAWVRRFGTGMGSLGRSCCDLLFPPRCIYCGEELATPHPDRRLCGDCLETFALDEWHGCNRCGAAVASGSGTSDDCESCRHSRLHFDAVIPLGGYHAGLRDAVLRMKRAAHDALSLAMGRLLLEWRQERLEAIRADVIVPIPMFWRRRLGRGKNSPELLAYCLARGLKVPVRPILLRRRNTLPQAGLAPRRRFENVREAFGMRRPDAAKGARILLVDNVLTTGATCSEAAYVLKRAGAAMVAVAVVARA